MRSVSVVRYSQVPNTPWKNGLGLTRQLAIHPFGATAENFEWRISVAQLEQSADFSPYPGIERCLAVLDGEMILARDSCEPQALSRESPPVTFSGEQTSSGQVVRAPVLDLNLMYRAAHWHASLSRFKSSGSGDSVTLQLAAWVSLVCSLAPVLHLQLAGLHFELGQYDLLCASGEWLDQLTAANDYDLYSIQLHRR
jgi:environmental stress-induced protein Ves